MQIVIDIPKEAYELLQTDGVDWLGAEHILDAVAKGRPLPEHHGRISDVGKVEKRILEYMNKHKDERGDGAYAALIMLNVETIIPATNAWTPKRLKRKEKKDEK